MTSPAILSVENTNFLSPTGFVLTFNRLPDLSYFCQKVALPSASVRVIEVPNPMLHLNLASTKMEYAKFSATFKVDEDMNNYYAMYLWMMGLSWNRHETNYFDTGPGIKTPPPGQGPRSDASLVILNSSKNPNIEITLIDCFPENLAVVPFDTTDQNINYVDCTVTFSFRYFKFVRE